MAPEAAVKSAKASKQEFDIISNRVALALAKRESLIKSWTSDSARSQAPTKTLEELEAEDATLFHNEPSHLGVGAPIPSQYLISDAERNNKSLRAKFFPTKGLKASKTRDAEEKAASAKRGLKDESSDDEEGRSGLGRAKKQKLKSSLHDVLNKVKSTEEDSKVNPVKKQKSKTGLKETLAKILSRGEDAEGITRLEITTKQEPSTKTQEQPQTKSESSLKKVLKKVISEDSDEDEGEDEDGGVDLATANKQEIQSKLREALAELNEEKQSMSKSEGHSGTDTKMTRVAVHTNEMLKAELKKKRKQEKKKLRKLEKRELKKQQEQGATGVALKG
ncbi:hypothetical protein G7Y89_g13562 [Cudoniella acicularis]|uniref:Uncharacterized protein n=1 Tax=Cudoniella acicularis TaxID=354080 RepID=A0A8H4R9B8_9HELO|nr:hypothetical protein G7Y89_g13562 [Cudoniella acicularis]